MKLGLRKGTFETIVIFIATPLLSLPLIFLQLRKKDQWGSVLLSLLLGVVAYNYIPSISNDKAKYYERYETFQDYTLSQFTEFLVSIKKPDFIFDFIIFFFSNLGIPLDFAFFVLTFLSVFTIFKIVNTIINKSTVAQYDYLFVSLMTLFSFSLPSLFSGLRFTLGATVFMYGVFQLLFKGNIRWGVIYLIVAAQIHFSLLFFLPAVLCVELDKRKMINYRILFLISFVFFLIPASFTGQLLSLLSISESLEAKTSVYVGSDDFVSQNFDSNQSSVAVYLLRTMWYYVMLAYLLIFHKKLSFDTWSSNILIFIYVCVFFVNFTFPFTTIFSRLTLFIKFLFLFHLLYQFFTQNNVFSKKALYVIFLFYVVTFIVDVNILRINFSESLFRRDSLTIIHMFYNKIIPNDFIQ